MQSPELRKHFRQLRRTLTEARQHSNAIQLGHLLDQHIGRRTGQRIAAYLAVQGEISLNHWIARNLRQQQIFLPRLYEPTEPKLRFAPIDADTAWTHNRFGIKEPDGHWGQTLAGQKMDMVLMPLVAFDRNGHRLGMGGGYYDRSMAFRRWRRHWTRPQLIGIAHSIQEHDQLPNNAWDVPLDMIITEREIICP